MISLLCIIKSSAKKTPSKLVSLEDLGKIQQLNTLGKESWTCWKLLAAELVVPFSHTPSRTNVHVLADAENSASGLLQQEPFAWGSRAARSHVLLFYSEQLRWRRCSGVGVCHSIAKEEGKQRS